MPFTRKQYDTPENNSFNPHPTRRLGAITFRGQLHVPCHALKEVSILTQPEGWVPYFRKHIRILSCEVSILTQPEGWVPYWKEMWHHIGGDSNVSILTQPEGWVPSPVGQAKGVIVPEVSILTQPEGWVPLLWSCHRSRYAVIGVSILTQPEGWVPCEIGFDPQPVFVSILTQPEGWVPYGLSSALYGDKDKFQSSPNPKVGCHLVSAYPPPTSQYGPSFNPHPTRRLGAIRPWLSAHGRDTLMFQSSPNPKVGCHNRDSSQLLVTH